MLDFQSAEEFLASDVPTSDACLLLDVYMPGMTGTELCRSAWLPQDGTCQRSC